MATQHIDPSKRIGHFLLAVSLGPVLLFVIFVLMFLPKSFWEEMDEDPLGLQR